MPKKKSIKLAAKQFRNAADEITTFLCAMKPGKTKEQVSWLHNYAIIRLYRDFEILILHALIGAINNDTSTLSSKTHISFPKHLTDEVCQYLIVGGGYFDFKGRDGLIKTIRKFVSDDHYLVTVVKKPRYKEALERLSTLRNFATHGSPLSKRQALEAVDLDRMRSSGSWLKCQGRFDKLKGRLKELADEIETLAPY